MENKETYGIILAAIDREPLWMSLWANFCTEGILELEIWIRSLDEDTSVCVYRKKGERNQTLTAECVGEIMQKFNAIYTDLT